MKYFSLVFFIALFSLFSFLLAQNISNESLVFENNQTYNQTHNQTDFNNTNSSGTTPTIELEIELISPQNGAFIEGSDLSFRFIVKNNTPKTNISCFLRVQSGFRFQQFGPLYLEPNKLAEFEFSNVKPNNYIWRILCEDYSSAVYVVIVSNVSYEQFLEDLAKQKQEQSNLNNTQTPANKSNLSFSNVSNKSNANLSKKVDSPSNNQTNNQTNLFNLLLLIPFLIIIAIVFYFLFFQKDKNSISTNKIQNTKEDNPDK
jgi:ATP-dependent Zn protease